MDVVYGILIGFGFGWFLRSLFGRGHIDEAWREGAAFGAAYIKSVERQREGAPWN